MARARNARDDVAAGRVVEGIVSAHAGDSSVTDASGKFVAIAHFSEKGYEFKMCY